MLRRWRSPWSCRTKPPARRVIDQRRRAAPAPPGGGGRRRAPDPREAASAARGRAIVVGRARHACPRTALDGARAAGCVETGDGVREADRKRAREAARRGDSIQHGLVREAPHDDQPFDRVPGPPRASPPEASRVTGGDAEVEAEGPFAGSDALRLRRPDGGAPASSSRGSCSERRVSACRRGRRPGRHTRCGCRCERRWAAARDRNRAGPDARAPRPVRRSAS